MSNDFSPRRVLVDDATLYELTAVASYGNVVEVNRWIATVYVTPAAVSSTEAAEKIATDLAHAVNCHADLLAACEAAADLLPLCSCDNGVHSPSGDSEGEHWLRLLRDQLAAAIAKAKGGAA